MKRPVANSCKICGATVDMAFLGGVCPSCLLGDVLGGGKETSDGGFDGHELMGEIARGGMGVVYRARQLDPERLVALKTLRGASLDSPEAMARFRHEAEVMVALDHAAILPVYHCGEQDGIPFFTMKLVEGGTLAERLTGYAGQWREIAVLTAMVCDAVRHAHERGVLHRDLKPGNILFDSAGQAYVSDFGIAKLAESPDESLTATRALMGTPHYLAPEVAAGSARSASVASDVWSLGVILYELLTGEKPFRGENLAQVLRALDAGQALAPRRVRAAVPRDLEVITLKALSREPTRRYATAQALAEDLRAWLEGRPIKARAVPAPERAWMWARRNPLLASTALLLALALVAAVASLAYGLRTAQSESRRVNAAQAETNQQLRVALLHQAHSGRISREMGWRRSGIEALRRSSAIRAGDDVRDELIAHLAGFDLEPNIRRFEDIILPSASLKHCVRTNVNAAKMIVARLDDLTPLFEAPIKYDGPYVQAMFGLEDRWVAIGNTTEVRAYSMEPGHAQLGRWEGFLLRGVSADRTRLHLQDRNHITRWRLIDTVTWSEIASGDTGPIAMTDDPVNRRIASFHPDSRLTLGVVLTNSEVCLFDWRKNEVLKRIKPVLPPITYRWSGPNLIIGCGDVGQVISFLSDREVLLGPGFSRPNYLMTANRNTELLASSENGIVALWHLPTGQRLANARNVIVNYLAADGVHFSGRDPHSQIGRIERPTVLMFLPDALLRKSLGVNARAMAISPDGRLLALHDATQVVVHELATGRFIARQEIDGSIALGFSADGGTLLVLHKGGMLGWKLGRKDERLTFTKEVDVPAPAGRSFVGGRVLQDGATFLGGTSKEQKYELYRIHRDHRRWARQPAPEAPWAGLFDVTPDGTWNTGAPEAYNVVNNIRKKQFLHLRPNDVVNACGAFSPDGTRLVFVDVRHRWTIHPQEEWLHCQDTKPAGKIVSAVGRLDSFLFAAWAPTGRWFAVSPDGNKVSLVEASNGSVYFTLESPIDLRIDAMLVSPDERTLVVQRKGGAVEIWHLDRLLDELGQQGVQASLPAAPDRMPTLPELDGKFPDGELPPLVFEQK